MLSSPKRDVYGLERVYVLLAERVDNVAVAERVDNPAADAAGRAANSRRARRWRRRRRLRWDEKGLTVEWDRRMGPSNRIICALG